MALITSGFMRGRGVCDVCGVRHSTCGDPSATEPSLDEFEEATVAGPLRKYRVKTPGGAEAILKLDEADAERLGGEPLDEPAAEQPVTASAPKARGAKNKARTAKNKA